MRKLLNEIDLSDRRLLQLLRRMRNLAQNGVSEELLKSLWLQRLSQQAILIAYQARTRKAIAISRITDVLSAGVNAVAAITPTKVNLADSQMSALLDRMEKLKTRLSRKSQASRKSRRRNRSRITIGKQAVLVLSVFWRKSYQVYAILQLEVSETGKLEAELSPAADNLVMAARHN